MVILRAIPPVCSGASAAEEAVVLAVKGVTIVDQLPEFRVTLTRLRPGEEAYPTDFERREEALGQRTKLGGQPDWEQDPQDSPRCRKCQRPATFVAQIDSVEYGSQYNPHGVDWMTDEQKWMFADVGMIYVFFCFDCLEPQAKFKCG